MKNLITNSLKYLKGIRVPLSPSSNALKGVQAKRANFAPVLILGLLTSFGKTRSRRFSIPTALVLTILSAVFGFSFFSHSAYAASYINVSSGSGGTVSLGSIKPSSSGVSTSGSDTLTIHTDCSTGYSVYVSGQKDKDTNLTNSSASSNNTIATSSTAVGSTATSLSTNTWGLNSENTGTYVGLPTYANATTKALVSKSSVSESSTVPIYYGVKVDTNLTPGTYTGNVLYTVMMDSSCLAYTVVFNSNGGTGTMNSQSIMTGTTTALSANTFTRSGYAFLGWSTKANGKTETAVNGIGTSADVDYADKAEVTNLATSGSSTTLYAIWQKVDGTMQSWTDCSALSVSDSVSLLDTRDNKVYAIKKLPDGKCWMMQNLTIGSTVTANAGMTLTKADTNIDNDTSYYLPPADKQGTGEITQLPNVNGDPETASFKPDSSIDRHAKTKFRTKNTSVTNDSDTSYYNFYTVTLGYSYYSSSGSGDGISQGSSTRDICPKGWRLPKTTDSGTNVTTVGSANDFTYLALQYDSSTGWNGSATGTSGSSYYNNNYVVRNPMHESAASPLATSTQNNFAGFSYSGLWGSSTNIIASYVGSGGYYWSSSIYNTNYGYYLGFNSLNVSPQNPSYKYNGAAVRCLAKYDYLVDYSSGGADSGSPSKTSDGAVLTSDSVTMPTVGSMVKSGYEFKGWALTSGASEAAYTAEESVSLTTLLSAASSSGQTTTPGSRLTLYPVWQETITYMQNWTGCSALSTNEYLTLRDSRDNNDYVVKKLADGKCWMVQNLRLTNYKLTSDDSDITDDFDLTTDMTYSDSSGWCQTTFSPTCTNVKAAYYNSPEASDSSKSSYYGALYNWYTATASTGTYSTIYNVKAASSICPKGWHLPTGGVRGEFVALDKAWGGNGSNRTSANTYNTFTGDYTSGSNGGFELAGYINGYVNNVNSDGIYWSSVASNPGEAYTLYLGKSDTRVYPWHGSHSKYYGLPVRCIAKDTRSLADITYMQEINSDIVVNTATNTYKQLIDKRDNNKYYAKKLADGKLWMVENLHLTNYKLTPADSDVSTGFDLTTGITYSDSSGWCQDNSSYCDDAKAVYYNSSEASNSSKFSYYGALYNWYTATAGTGKYATSSGNAASSICPKGWRLPTGDSSGEFAALDIAWGGDGSNQTNAKTYNTFIGSYTSGNNGGFGLAGYIYEHAFAIGDTVGYWSSTARSSDYAWRLRLTKVVTTVAPQEIISKFVGHSVRCIAE